ncbi:MAG: acyltransferase [Ignavibacteriaceae bacterium]|nr:acyltransferase [Ignavibacteriaceae bacterium]MCK6615928.1 acyltransferase [Ignavibacteriaceae bacterium]
MINSDNRGYHLNMFNRCKILIDRPGASIAIGSNTRIHGTCLHAYKKIVVGKNCLIAANTQIIDGNGHDLLFENVEMRINSTGKAEEIIIEDNVWIGTGVIILPGVRIGNGSVITANSVVIKDIPPMVLAGGNPARIIKDYRL